MQFSYSGSVREMARCIHQNAVIAKQFRVLNELLNNDCNLDKGYIIDYWIRKILI